MSRALVALALLALCACTGAEKKPVGAPHPNPQTDAGPPDAGAPDSGPGDAGPDAGPPDAGPPDAGSPDAGLGGPCTNTHDCIGGQVCIVGTCGQPGSVPAGSPCTASRDCVSGLYCSPVGFCMAAGTGDAGATCSTDADCAGGLRCSYDGLAANCEPGGTGEAGDSCTGQDSCLPGLFCSAASPRSCQTYASAFPAYPGVSCENDDGGLRVYFEVPRTGVAAHDFFRLPYPTDVRVTNGALDISDFPTAGMSVLDVDVVALYRDALMADFAGFSAVAPVTFRFSKEIDISSLNNSIAFIDLTNPNDFRPFFFYFSYIINGNHYNCPNRLTVGPGESSPLRPGHTYAVVLKAGIKDASNHGVLADADLTAVLSSTQPTDTGLVHAWNAFAPLRTYMADASHNLSASAVVGASVFTVADITGPMAKVAQAVSAAPAPSLTDLAVCGSGQTSTCDALGADHACAPTDGGFTEIHGRLSLPIYQAGTEPYATVDAGGGIVFDSSGNPVHQRDENVCFALTVPNGAPPVGGWPLVITHHGTGGSMTDFISGGVAGRLASATTPAAVLGFDAVEHADRRGGSTISPEKLVFNFFNPRAARDNFVQGAADILGEAKVAGTSINVAGLASAITFDATKVSFFGHSQGATSGELALPYLSAAPNAVVSGAGAHLTQSLLHKTSPFPIKARLALAIQEDVGQFDTEHPVLGLIQNYYDRSDPMNYNNLIISEPPTGLAAHSVLMTWGTGDTFTPPETLQANAVSMGLPVVGTVLEGGGFAGPLSRPVSGNLTVNSHSVTGVMVQYASPSGTDGHFVAFDVPGAESDWTQFLESGWAGTPSLQ